MTIEAHAVIDAGYVQKDGQKWRTWKIRETTSRWFVDGRQVSEQVMRRLLAAAIKAGTNWSFHLIRVSRNGRRLPFGEART